MFGRYEEPREGIDFRARMKVRDFLTLLALLGVGGNTVWCWHHADQIRKLQDDAPKTKIERTQDNAARRYALSKSRP